MIEKMEKVYIYSLKDQTTSIMEAILKCGVVQPEETQSMLSEDTAKVLAPGEGMDLSREEALLDRIQEGISILKPFGKKKGLFAKRPVVSYDELTDEQILMESMQTCNEIEGIIGDINELKKQIRAAQFKETSYLPWENLDFPIEEMATASCSVSFYLLQEPRTVDDVRKAAEDKELPLFIQEVSSEKENHYIALLYHNKDAKAVRETVSVFGAREFSMSEMYGTFKDRIAECQQEIKELEAAVAAKEEELAQMGPKLEGLQLASDAVKVRIQCFSGQENFMQTETVNIITGWIPERQKEALNSKLDEFGCYCEYEVPEKDEDYPVLMKNSKIVEPFGALTEMYSMPNPHSIDTNWAIGLFFFIFFGMMLSDAGYGLVLIIGGFLGSKFLDVGEGAKRLMKMIGIAGISTVFWGALYGSWFGDVVPKVAETFLGKTVTIPQLIDPLNEPMTILIMSCAFGVVHLFVGMGIKAYIMIKRGNLLGAIFDIGFWYILLIGLPLLLAPAPFNTVGKVMAIAGAVGLVLTQGRHKPTIIGKITGGVMSLYDITSYFSDVLSYSRILALGLATGVIASVVNVLATMAGGGIIGVIAFVVIFVFGHLLNLGINALGSYVHSARLQYVEFFGKYYEGGGTKFDPLKIKTKYVKVTEEK